ncbi:MAG: SPOR domain-containing protein [Nitrospirae bacterium]|nr:SPOR domain-containing protein [Nitrospirota bacterium]
MAWRHFNRKDTETGRSDIIAELEEALLDTDLDQYAVDSIVDSLRKRRRRRAIIRGIVIFATLFAVSTAFFLAFRTGRSGKPDVTASVIVLATSTTSTSTTTTTTAATTATTTTAVTTTTTVMKPSPIPDAVSPERMKRKKTAQAAAQQEKKKYSQYAVVVSGLDGTKASAERIHAKLHQAGYSSELKKEAATGGKSAAHHVYVGHFRNQADAEAFRKLLWKNEGIRGSVVGRE